MKWTIAIGICCVALLEGMAMYTGHNGTYFALSIGAIGAMVGVVIPTPKILKGSK